jgi:hypothetical protein
MLFYFQSLNIFYLLKCAKKIRHKLNKLMKSSPIYNKLQHYLILHVYKYFLHYIVICVDWTKNSEWRKEWDRGVSGDDECDCSFVELLDNKKPFGPLYIFKHLLKNNFVLFIWECRITTGQKHNS